MSAPASRVRGAGQVDNWHRALKEALLASCPAQKCVLVACLAADGRVAGLLEPVPAGFDRVDARAVGRPVRPLLVPAQDVPRRRPSSRAGHAALLHAIAHIEFNAINLALDCLHRFTVPDLAFYEGWLQVAAEEALHFGLVRARLQTLGHDYGDFPAHDGLWQMAVKTAHDPLLRMALVPRVLEARGLDATPAIMEKLRRIGDDESVTVLERILRDEIGHVALGDRWFRHFCRQRGLVPEATYLAAMRTFEAPFPRPPLHEAARLAAGFSRAELAALLEARQ